MKKIALFICMACVAMGMSAQTITGRSRITLSTAGETDKEVRLLLSNSFSNDWDNTWDATPAQDGGIYVLYQGAKYSIWASNEYSENLPLAFKAVANTEYSLSFSSFLGVPYTVYDLVAKKTISVNTTILVDGVAAEKYDFTVAASERDANNIVANRFVINYVAPVVAGYNVTLNGVGLASFSADGDDATIPDGVEAYTATYQDATQEIVLNKINATAIPAGVGVILYGTPGAAVTLPYTTGADALTADNDLYPATAWATADKNNVFVLSGNQMFKYVGTDPVPANKAFMKLPGGANNAPARISMRFNTTTAVENVETEAVQPVKFIENGEIFIRRGNEVYNLQGQLVK